MTFAYMPYWKKVDAKVEGASQRIQEDCMNFAKIVESIGLQIVRAINVVNSFYSNTLGFIIKCYYTLAKRY